MPRTVTQSSGVIEHSAREWPVFARLAMPGSGSLLGALGKHSDVLDDGVMTTAELNAPGVLGRPRARGWIHLYSAAVAALMSLALIPFAFVLVGAGAALACTVYA